MLYFESHYLCHEPMQSISIFLIGTSNCHLCEDAERILQAVLSSINISEHEIAQKKLDVMDDNDLYQNYGINIPVLQLKQNHELLGELYWPFDTITLNLFLKEHLSINI